jgi:hypothetical protein
MTSTHSAVANATTSSAPDGRAPLLTAASVSHSGRPLSSAVAPSHSVPALAPYVHSGRPPAAGIGAPADESSTVRRGSSS